MKKYLFSIICTLLPIFASAQEPYAIFIDNGTALEFRYDNEKAARGGMDIGPFTSMDQVPWHENSQNIYSVIFDPSFANCTSITSTSLWFAFLSNLDYILCYLDKLFHYNNIHLNKQDIYLDIFSHLLFYNIALNL